MIEIDHRDGNILQHFVILRHRCKYRVRQDGGEKYEHNTTIRYDLSVFIVPYSKYSLHDFPQYR